MPWVDYLGFAALGPASQLGRALQKQKKKTKEGERGSVAVEEENDPSPGPGPLAPKLQITRNSGGTHTFPAPGDYPRVNISGVNIVYKDPEVRLVRVCIMVLV